MTTNNNITESDENFLKNFLKNFYHKIIDTEDFNTFEDISIKWMKNELENNDKDPESLLKMMQNHKRHQIWFTSIMGFFYQHGIGCKVDKNNALEIYLYIIVNEEKFIYLNTGKIHLFTLNNIIGKYLLSLYYYKDIIIDKKYLLQWNKKYASNGKPLTKDQLGNYSE